MTVTTIAPPVATPRVTVAVDRCAGCQECLVRCPTAALHLDPATWTVLAEEAACVGCRQCERTCPFAAIEVDGPVLVAPRANLPFTHPQPLAGSRAETRGGLTCWDDALAEARRCLTCPDPTCLRGCPAHNDIPGFLTALAEGDLAEAHQVLRATTVLPDICARVCDQALQCEGACTWALAGGEPVAIGALERFVADHAPVPPLERTSSRGVGLAVAVVGSGPAGISAAWHLRAAGAEVTVYERDPQPGGLLRWGIPAFTLPPEIARRPWEQLRAAGVNLLLDHPVGPEEMQQLRWRHDAVVVCTGAPTPVRPQVPGADLAGVWDATRFLTHASAALAGGARWADLDVPPGQGHDDVPVVLVLGAGNTAMDVARCARRLGARATCVEWTDRRFAPVRPDELLEAEAEGVQVRFATTLHHLEGDHGRVRTAVLSRTRQHRGDRRPKVVAPAALREPVDLVVFALGYRTDDELRRTYPELPLRPSAAELPERRWLASGMLAGAAGSRRVGRLAVQRDRARRLAGQARAERTWVAGDALVGPSTVVEAMAQGAAAAQALLEQWPTRPRRSRSQPSRAHSRHVLVAVSERTGPSGATAERLATDLRHRGLEPLVTLLSQVGRAQVGWADLLVAGVSAPAGAPAGAPPGRNAGPGLRRRLGPRAAQRRQRGAGVPGCRGGLRAAAGARGRARLPGPAHRGDRGAEVPRAAGAR